MSRKQIQFGVLRQVVTDQPRAFTTKDVSEDERMRRAHPEFTNHTHYHAFVGGVLSDHHETLGIVEVRKATSRGSRWEKQGFIEIAMPPDGKMSAKGPPVHDHEHPSGLGPQYSKDSPFAARMRLHQSWYRANVLRVPYGTGPTPTSTSLYGNMLTSADGERGCNFLSPEIAQVARDRVSQGTGMVDDFRLFRNMLSSQPMCFNLFAPLVNDRALACRLLSPLLPDGLAEVTRVAIEWAPQPPDAYLGDRTAFDAFIEYRAGDGQLCALGVETKLAEPFSQREYDGERYRRWMRVSDSPWRPEATSRVHAIAHNQLWRDHLLAIAMRHQPHSPYATTRLMLVRHPEDRDCAHVFAGYRELLRDNDDSLIDMPLDRLIDAWTSAIGADPQRAWINEFRVRYLALESQ